MTVTTEPPAPAPATTETRPGDAARFPCFDGLRGIAALLVVVHHVFVKHDLSTHGRSWKWIDRFGNFGVAIFFIISGFLLYRPFVLAHFQSRRAPNWGRFWKRRFFRIYPAYWLALTVMVYVLHLFTINGTDVFTLYPLLQNYRAAYPLYGLGVEWTLVIEVSFYVALPFIALAIRAASRGASLRSKLTAQLVGLAVMYLAAMVVRVYQLWIQDIPVPNRGDWFPAQNVSHWIIGYLDWFALGMLLAVGSAWLAMGGRLPWAVRALARHPGIAWLLALECFWIGNQLNLPRSPLSPTTRIQTFGVAFVFGVVAVLLVFPAVFGDQDEGWIRRVLKSRSMKAVGAISYGIYLWHIVWLNQVAKWAKNGSLTDNVWVWFVLVLVFTFAAATVSYHAVEKPLIKLSHR